MPHRDSYVPDDTGEAKIIRAQTRRELAEMQAQIVEINSLVAKIHARREHDIFGTDLAVTFNPKKRGSTND